MKKKWLLKLCAKGPFVVLVLGAGSFVGYCAGFKVGAIYVSVVGLLIGLVSLSVWADMKLYDLNKKDPDKK